MPGVCRECRQPVVYVRAAWRDPFARGLGMPHVCGFASVPVYPSRVCGVWMPRAGERCARTPGHGYEHRSSYALETQRRAWAA